MPSCCLQSALQRVSGRGEAEPEGESASQALTGSKEAEEELERAIKVKTTENNLHGSFFLRIGALGELIFVFKCSISRILNQNLGI